MRGAAILLMTIAAGPVGAEWEFSPPREVSGALVDVFPHLESAGRRSLAVGDGGVAVVWEDNRSGSPQVYLAVGKAEGAFSGPRRLSTGEEAFEPAITAASDGRFVVTWEQDGAVWGAVAVAENSGAPRRLSGGAAGQATVTARPGEGVLAAWSAERGPHRGIVLATIALDGLEIAQIEQRPVGKLPEGDQLYPALAAADDALVLAWEDRRAGHTRLYVTRSRAGRELEPVRLLNELPPDSNPQFGRGSGVTRVALAAGPEGRVAAAWMDKRAFRGGYDIYAAVSDDGGADFGHNELVQDMFGENTPQWHPSVAVGPKRQVAVAWDDPRDGTPDVWVSRRTGAGEWSDDIAVTPAYGPGAQSSPSIAFGADGTLHLAWVERQDDQSPRLLYATGRWIEEE